MGRESKDTRPCLIINAKRYNTLDVPAVEVQLQKCFFNPSRQPAAGSSCKQTQQLHSIVEASLLTCTVLDAIPSAHLVVPIRYWTSPQRWIGRQSKTNVNTTQCKASPWKQSKARDIAVQVSFKCLIAALVSTGHHSSKKKPPNANGGPPDHFRE